MQFHARRFDNAAPVSVHIDHGRIDRIEAVDVEPAVAALWPWIAPGLVDLQVNGYGGQEFSSGRIAPDDVERILRRMDAFGVTRAAATVTTHRPEVMEHAVRTIARAAAESRDAAARLAGIHVEGPFLSPEDGPRGAHPRPFVRPPSLDEFHRLQDAARGGIRILTLSPEYDGAPEFIAAVVQTGVLVAIGHTAAQPARIRAAVDAGATMSTHLGNGAHALIPRHGGYLWAQLAEDRLVASLIADGHHLPADVLKTFVRAKTVDRCVLISDLSGMAGLAPGVHEGELCRLEILPNGKFVVAGQTEVLAGASVPLGQCAANVVHMAGASLAEAIHMASTRPSRWIGLAPGGLAAGDAADLVLFHLIEPGPTGGPPRFDVQATVLGGRVVHGAVSR
ncbi:MAG: amidohydrolase family protein [Pirellulales bacterium]|nr:amidohydrolase family protein [Pirellulales bacterium]